MVNETAMGERPLVDDQLYVDIYARGEDGISVAATEIKYMVSDDGVNHPDKDAAWSDTIPAAGTKRFLWTKTTYAYTNDRTEIVYTVSGYGATFIPNVDENGNISWTNDKGYINPQTQNITGPQGIPGPLDIQIVESLISISDPSDTTFYAVPAALTEYYSDLDQRTYDLYYYVLPEENENFGHFERFNASSIVIQTKENSITYYLTGGITTAGNSFLYGTGVTYTKAQNETKGIGRIDGDKITTGLFYDIH